MIRQRKIVLTSRLADLAVYRVCAEAERSVETVTPRSRVNGTTGISQPSIVYPSCSCPRWSVTHLEVESNMPLSLHHVSTPETASCKVQWDRGSQSAGRFEIVRILKITDFGRQVEFEVKNENRI